MFEVKFTCQKLLLLGILMMLTHRDETKATEASNPSTGMDMGLGTFTTEGLVTLKPPAVNLASTAYDELGATSPSENFSHLSKVSIAYTQMKIGDRWNKVVKTSRKLLRDSNKGNVANRQSHDETWFKPGKIHKGVEVDTAGSVAFTADYRPPRRHPPKNN